MSDTEVEHHHGIETMGNRRLIAAIAVNMLLTLTLTLTLAQVIGGIASGSLALIADALHNFSDAVSVYVDEMPEQFE